MAPGCIGTRVGRQVSRLQFPCGRLGGEHGQEVSGRVPPARLVASPRLPPPVQRNKHLPSAMLPAEGGISVVAVFLDALLELAARVVLHLRLEEEERSEVNPAGLHSASFQVHKDYSVVAVRGFAGVCI